MFFAQKELSLEIRLRRPARGCSRQTDLEMGYMTRHLFKFALTALLAVAAAECARAQTMTADELFPDDAGRRRLRLRTEWNVMAGATFAGWSADRSDISFDPKTGFHIGFDMGLLLGRRCAIVPELRFTHTSVGITGAAGYVQRVKNNALEMPLMFEYRILHGRLRFHAGPSFTLMDRNNASYRTGDTLDLTQGDGMRLRPTVTYVAGVRGLLGRRVSVGVRFNGQFNGTEQFIGISEDGPSTQNYRLNGWRLSVSAGYRF